MTRNDWADIDLGDTESVIYGAEESFDIPQEIRRKSAPSDTPMQRPLWKLGHIEIAQLFHLYAERTRSQRSEKVNGNLNYRLRVLGRACARLGITTTRRINDATWGRLDLYLRANDYAELTVRTYLSTWKAIVKWACRRGMLFEHDLGDMRLCIPRKGRARFLSRAEIDVLLESVRATRLELPVVFGMYQGMRRGEVCALHTHDVDLERGTVDVLLTKNGESRTIGLHGRMLDYLPHPIPSREWMCVDNGDRQWLGDHMGKVFKTQARHLGWDDVSFHTLRHTCASQMAQSGRFSLFEISRFLGHKTMAVTEQYAHLVPDKIRPDW